MTNVRNMLIILGHWLLHAYCIIAITELKEPKVHGSLVLLVPCPAVFYLITVRFTNPNDLETVN